MAVNYLAPRPYGAPVSVSTRSVVSGYVAAPAPVVPCSLSAEALDERNKVLQDKLAAKKKELEDMKTKQDLMEKNRALAAELAAVNAKIAALGPLHGSIEEHEKHLEDAERKHKMLDDNIAQLEKLNKLKQSVAAMAVYLDK